MPLREAHDNYTRKAHDGEREEDRSGGEALHRGLGGQHDVRDVLRLR